MKIFIILIASFGEYEREEICVEYHILISSVNFSRFIESILFQLSQGLWFIQMHQAVCDPWRTGTPVIITRKPAILGVIRWVRVRFSFVTNKNFLKLFLCSRFVTVPMGMTKNTAGGKAKFAQIWLHSVQNGHEERTTWMLLMKNASEMAIIVLWIQADRALQTSLRYSVVFFNPFCVLFKIFLCFVFFRWCFR